MLVPIDEVVYFDAITSSPTTGAASDADSTPTFAVYEESTDTDIGVGGNMTKRTSLTGNYRASFTASAANGFEAGKWYSVIASATVGGVAGKARVMHFRCCPAEASAGIGKVDTSYWNGSAVATPDTAGYPKVTHKTGVGTGELTINAGAVSSNVTQWGGTLIPLSDTAGYPKVTVKSGTGTGEVSLSSGNVTASLTTAAIQAIWDKATSALTTVGSIGKWIVDQLGEILLDTGTTLPEQINGVSGGNTTVQPYSTHAPQRVKGTSVTAFLGEGSDVSITLSAYDADGEPLTLTGLSLSLIIAAYDDPDTPLIAPQDFTGSGSTFSLTLDTVVTATEVLAGKAHHWSLRDGTKVIQRGRLEVVTTAAQGA